MIIFLSKRQAAAQLTAPASAGFEDALVSLSEDKPMQAATPLAAASLTMPVIARSEEEDNDTRTEEMYDFIDRCCGVAVQPPPTGSNTRLASIRRLQALLGHAFVQRADEHLAALELAHGRAGAGIAVAPQSKSDDGGQFFSLVNYVTEYLSHLVRYLMIIIIADFVLFFNEYYD